MNQEIEKLKTSKIIESAPSNSSSYSQKSTLSNYSNSYAVYIINTGSKYHRDGCSYLKKSQIATDKSSAISQGYSACSRCNP